MLVLKIEKRERQSNNLISELKLLGDGTLKDQKKTYSNLKNIILVTCSILLLIGLVFYGSQSLKHSNKNTNNTKAESSLNMAIVNEDNGTTYRNKYYELGKDYLNGLKLPEKVSMVVVPRGVAENGLKKNNYQLVVYIPTNFSQKIVDIDNPDPQKLNIQYKINAKNQTMKIRCKNEAEDIIDGLNQKLVSIYNLGIMSNLYDAQNKVAGIYNRQDQLANNYQNSLANPIASFSQSFPDLQGSTKAMMEQSKAVQQGVSEYNRTLLQSRQTQAQEMQTTLAKIMQEQSQNNQNNAKLVQSILDTSQTTIAQETPHVLDALTTQNQQLSQTLGTSKEAAEQLTSDFETYSKGYEDKVASVKKLLDNTDKGDLDQGTDNGDKHQITFGEYLQKSDPQLYQQIIEQSKSITDLNQLYAQLPYATNLPKKVQNALSNEDLKAIKSDLQIIKQTNEQLTKEGMNPIFNGNSSQAAEFDDALKDDNTQTPSSNEQTQTQTITIGNIKNLKPQKDEFTISVPAGVKLSGNNLQGINGNTYRLAIPENTNKVDLTATFKASDLQDKDPKVTVTYTHAKEDPQKVTVTKNVQNPKQTELKENKEASSQGSMASSMTSSKSDVEHEVVVENETQEISNDTDRQYSIEFNLANNYEKPLPTSAKVSKITGKWVAQYHDAAQMAQARVELVKNGAVSKLMNQKLGTILSSLVNKANEQNKNILTILTANEKELQQQKSNYEQQLSSIGENSANALENVQKQLTALQQAQDQLKETAKNLQSSDEQSKQQNNTNEDTGYQELSTNADKINDSVNSDNDQFSGIYTELTNLDRTLSETQNSSKGLNNKSVDLQKAFRNELAKSGNFTQSFINVLNAAYQNGVPNQKLLNFITDPLQSDSQEVISERTQSYNMGLWTLILIILAWFIAYMIENLPYLRAGKYFSNAKTKLGKNTWKLIWLLVPSSVTGGILAMIAANMFPIIATNKFAWYLSFVELSSGLTLICYALIHYLKFGGTAVIMAVILNFIFNQNQLLQNTFLSKINILQGVSTQLLNVVMFNISDAILGMVMLGVMIVICGILILFIPDRKQGVENA